VVRDESGARPNQQARCFVTGAGFLRCETVLTEHEEFALKPKESRRSFHYQNRLVWDTGRRGSVSIEGKPVLQVSSPPEFKGDPGCWSPEDMLVAAASACLLMTFLAYAQREELEPVSYASEAEGTLEFADGRYCFTELTLRPRLTFRTEEDAEIAQMVLEQAHRDCIITNSIMAVVKLEPEISVEVVP
jgi:peroxiredoxin-like protein